MAFPTVESLTETPFGSNATEHLVAMPATVNSGDLLVALFSNDGDSTVTTPGGWSLLGTETADAAADDRLSIYSRDADGTEGGTTVDFVTSADQQAAAQVYRITGWGGTVPDDTELGSFATGSDANPDPPSLSPSWGAEDTLWLAISNHIDGDRNIDVYPASYTDGTMTVASAAAGTSLQSARRELNAASEDPGAFTIDASRRWAAVTLAIQTESPGFDDHITILNSTDVGKIPHEA